MTKAELIEAIYKKKGQPANLTKKAVSEIVESVFDEVEQNPFQTQEDGSVLVDAGVDIETFQEYFDLPGEKGNYETLAGLIFDLTGRVPLPEETIPYKHLKLEIAAADPKRIRSVRVFRLAPDPSRQKT